MATSGMSDGQVTDDADRAVFRVGAFGVINLVVYAAVEGERFRVPGIVQSHDCGSGLDAVTARRD